MWALKLFLDNGTYFTKLLPVQFLFEKRSCGSLTHISALVVAEWRKETCSAVHRRKLKGQFAFLQLTYCSTLGLI